MVIVQLTCFYFRIKPASPTPQSDKGKDKLLGKRMLQGFPSLFCGACALVPSVEIVLVLLIDSMKTELQTLERKAVE